LVVLGLVAAGTGCASSHESGAGSWLHRLADRQARIFSESHPSRVRRVRLTVGSTDAIEFWGRFVCNNTNCATDACETSGPSFRAHPYGTCVERFSYTKLAVSPRTHRVVLVKKRHLVSIGWVGGQRAFFTPGRNGASCEIDVGVRSLRTEVWCLGPVRSLAEARRAIAARLLVSGRVQVCHGMRCVGNSDGPPILRYGRSISLGPFRCTALRVGVRCVAKSTGRGFLLTAHAVKRVEPRR
jgi:hypothetical protein